MAKRSRKRRKQIDRPVETAPKKSTAESRGFGSKAELRTPAELRPVVWGSIFIRALIVVLAGWWVFQPALHGGWIWDDTVYIPQNPLAADPDRLWKIWFQPGSFIEYYPIEQTVQWIEWDFFRNDTFGYHAVNLVLHVLGAWLVWRLLSKFSLRWAWAGGLVFAIHPAIVESVAWMSELKNTLSLPPFLMAACAFIDYDNRGRRADYILSLGWFLVAMLCKISMAPFPVIILLYAWWKRGRIGWSDLKASAPFFVVSLILGGVTIMAGIWFRPSHHMPPDNVIVGGFFSRIALMGLLIAWYFYLVVFPITHSFFYPKWTVDPPAIAQFLTWPLLLGVLYYLWARRKTWGKHVLLGLGFFLINLAPFLGATVPSYMGFTWAMDHFLYLPIIGLIGLFVAGVEQFDRTMSRRWRPALMALLVIIGIGLAVSSRLYAATFASAIALWGHTVAYDSNSGTARKNYASALMHDGQLDTAIDQFKLAIPLDPRDCDVHDDLGQALAQAGHLPEAMAEFNEAIRLNSVDPSSFANRGHLWQIMGQPDKAIADLTRAIELNPDLPQPYINRSSSLQLKGDWQGALSDLEQFCRLAPHDPNTDYAHFWIWFLRVQHGQETEADQELAAALQNSWNSPYGEWTSQIARFLLGQIKEDEFSAAASATNPDQDRYQKCEAWYYAGMMRLLMANKPGAIEAFQKCLATNETQETAYILAQGQLHLLTSH